ncbi:hypothetical protein N0V93_003790 [Gnomoniopsis smithogilvyi]|uniref:Uncharacterized protein n=1 Tax=Gnomoniopsis smithogilvyi TaxID=1191159 RepID=A0A9W9CZG7_9PEZI|nr:hypothetical protein N0V93_003790 [Gnomoniopsis smithogilvyi]
MQLKQNQSPILLAKPQLPRALWIRSLRFGDADFNRTLDLTKECKLFYEIVLYYDHNRACTIFRTPDDFRMLKSGIGKLSQSHGSRDEELVTWDQPIVEDVEVLQQYLCEVISKKAKSRALEFFLRRRMEDCGGG